MDQYGNYYVRPGYSAAVRAQPVMKRRKSSRIGGVLRKLLGRKSLRSQSSELSPTAQYPSEPTEFITSAIEPRDQRTVSLPVNQVSRASALGSHSPFPSTLGESLQRHQTSPSARRRASMPSIVDSTPEPLAGHLVPERPTEDTANIGYAVTSGSHPRRRSRSADALHDLVRGRDARHRARSDQLRYWRDSIGPDASIDSDLESDRATRRVFRLQEGTEVATEDPQAARGIAENTAGSLEFEQSDRRNMPSFDFNRLATTFNQDETIPLPERMTIAEVKLMDLEYAVSKLQGRSPSGGVTPRAEKELGSASSVPNLSAKGLRGETPHDSATNTGTRAKRATGVPSVSGSASTTAKTVSTQPTAPSLSIIASGEDPFAEDKLLRPLSIETSLHRPEAGPATTAADPRASIRSGIEALAAGRSGETPEPQDSGAEQSSGGDNTTASPRRSTAARPLSLTSISIDHFATLVTLLKREQHARIRLEAELADLRRDVWHMLYPTPAPTTTLLASSSPTTYSSNRPSSSSERPVRLSPPSARSASGGRDSTGSRHPTHQPNTSSTQPSSNPPTHPYPSATATTHPFASSAHSLTGGANGSLYRQRRWDGSRRDVVRIDDFHVARRRPSYEGETSFDEPIGHFGTPERPAPVLDSPARPERPAQGLDFIELPAGPSYGTPERQALDLSSYPILGRGSPASPASPQYSVTTAATAASSPTAAPLSDRPDRPFPATGDRSTSRLFDPAGLSSSAHPRVRATVLDTRDSTLGRRPVDPALPLRSGALDPSLAIRRGTSADALRPRTLTPVPRGYRADGHDGRDSAASSATSDAFATPVEQAGGLRFEIAAGLGVWGRDEGEAF